MSLNNKPDFTGVQCLKDEKVLLDQSKYTTILRCWKYTIIENFQSIKDVYSKLLFKLLSVPLLRFDKVKWTLFRGQCKILNIFSNGNHAKEARNSNLL
jgi:hypothetical protein